MTDIIDQRWPVRGPCAFCGWPDARHRIMDAIRERRSAGESIESLAYDYEASAGEIAAVLALPETDTRIGPPVDDGDESSADELERLAQEHEDEEYRYRESQAEERRGK